MESLLIAFAHGYMGLRPSLRGRGAKHRAGSALKSISSICKTGFNCGLTASM